jgi:hypothetical protein
MENAAVTECNMVTEDTRKRSETENAEIWRYGEFDGNKGTDGSM